MSLKRRRRQQDDFAKVVDDLPDLKHSGLGIASCIFAVVACGGYLLSVVYIIMIGGLSLSPAQFAPQEELQEAGAYFIIFAFAVLNLFGFALGFIGILQSTRKVAFSALGMICNFLSPAVAMVLVCCGGGSVEPI